MDHGAIRSAADAAKSKLRASLHELSRRFAEEQRSYKGLDGTVFILYAIECFLQALASTDRGKDFVLKGGNLFRAWDQLDSFRPTGDLDMQCVDNVREFEDVVDLREEVAAVVCTDAFRDTTGLVFEMDKFKLYPIQKGDLVAYRLDGKALLGHPFVEGQRPAEIPFTLEVTYGSPPDGAVELTTWKSIIPHGDGFRLQASKMEWMAAEKYHSLVTRGVANTRLKDYRDLSVLLSENSFDDKLFQSCIQQVFEELGQAHMIPEVGLSVPTLTVAFVTPQNESLWQRRRWPEWEGRSWTAARDPSLAETTAIILVQLERRGLVREHNSFKAASALADACAAARILNEDGLSPVASARFATTLKMTHALWSATDYRQASWRWLGMARAAGHAGESALEAFDGLMRTAESLDLLSAIDIGWNRGRGGGREALQRLRNVLQAPLYGASAESQAPHDDMDAAPRVGRKTRATQANKASPDQVMANGVTLLRESRPASHLWFGGLAKVLGSTGARIPFSGETAIEVPDDPRAPFIWVQVARKQGIEENLALAVLQANEILGLDMVRLARAR